MEFTDANQFLKTENGNDSLLSSPSVGDLLTKIQARNAASDPSSGNEIGLPTLPKISLDGLKLDLQKTAPVAGAEAAAAGARKVDAPQQVNEPAAQKAGSTQKDAPVANEKAVQGIDKINEFFASSHVQSMLDKHGAISAADIKSIGVKALAEGRLEDQKAAAFVEKNFSQLSSLHADNTLFPDRKVSTKDIQELPKFDESLSKGLLPSSVDARYNYGLQAGAVLLGAGLGAALQYGTRHMPYGALVESIGVTLATTIIAPAGGIGGYVLGSTIGNAIEGRDNSYLQYPIGVATMLGGGALGLQAGSRAWGPSLGAAIGLYAVTAHGDKIWSSRHKSNYENMLGDLRKF